MFKFIGIVLIGGLAGYALGVAAGIFIVNNFSTNVQDKPLELAMTSIFFFGPMGALIGLIIAVVYQLLRRYL
ncbi:unknown protein (plasmid) [Synechocystis sp. PCC 6803]|uniref:Uncharacterized protein n=1 Tax=Synechocystis sp. (strain ATCC 27184 / PCC 6803 / Kazusa) TaxID=1111708 RepID=Q6ZEQ6_SYNY3|nr:MULTISPECIES: hypothetical protein [unclassified Synechocystis]AGF53501.1 hypothetical protein MYO_2750 [Synechocystis sp. PCC 6803]AVP91621.1 hypothetical protein C7I86_17825 [Synechocystis sp. IPPAS B-1465]MBD2619899.1 hypothetical protein [Synechocystis sp. FACHB-898]MBD2640810.1 hypothetical protein [Synechocystis sp. FACHB-908]MBD2662698.1 hypothetical protein [Synechocystis sp. FACHB-929]